MKCSYRRNRVSPAQGFTLVELLVVIAIIAILASVILYAGGAAIRAAKRTKAANMANQLQTAALGYYTEYSIYPIPTGQAASTDFLITDASGSAATWAGMIYGLSGNVNPYNASTTQPSAYVPNTRGIAFITLKNTDVDSNNAPLNPLPPSTANPYFNIAIDGDYSGLLGDSASAITGKMPAFTPPTIGSGTIPMTGTSTAGIAVWANCVGNATTVNSNQWVHTY
jgi:prepilin-type N-terminal cleavage/methylation domain-containing protein